jgi:hypothetical protein
MSSAINRYPQPPPRINFLSLWENGRLSGVDYRQAVSIQNIYDRWYAEQFLPSPSLGQPLPTGCTIFDTGNYPITGESLYDP